MQKKTKIYTLYHMARSEQKKWDGGITRTNTKPIHVHEHEYLVNTGQQSIYSLWFTKEL